MATSGKFIRTWEGLLCALQTQSRTLLPSILVQVGMDLQVGIVFVVVVDLDCNSVELRIRNIQSDLKCSGN
jgi:hypothetical protein